MTFGSELRRLRRRRGMSQLTLSQEVGTGQRHISFLERDKASPGRPLVLRLAEHLGLTSTERDDLLLAAGLVPEAVRPEPDSLPLDLLESVVSSYLPYPAAIIGPLGGVVAANAALTLVTDGKGPAELREPASLCRLLTSRAANPASWAGHVLAGMRTLARRTAGSPGLVAFIGELAEHVTDPMPDHLGFTTSLRLRSSRGDLNLTIVTTTLGTAAEPTLNGCLLKTFLPADARTAELFHSAVLT
ncbi:helix-turn-helix domain-containing protein [Nonomuraea sp. NPDC050556]|uniref:MmyB family transcriptional regulator n=1 Tax=Nonomuraea sp. NPDC050556 TaxID=3364369 RepID=UPI00378B1AC8